MSIKSITKRILRSCLGDYEYWKVFAIDLPQPPASLPLNVSVRPLEHERPLASSVTAVDITAEERDTLGFGLYDGDMLVAKQWYWWGARYEKERQGRSWHLPPNTAKSTNLYTVPEYRGRGYATLLKRHTAYLMSERGFTQLYSRIWHNHYGSIRVSEKNGWRIVGYYLQVSPLSKRIEIRIHR